MPPAQFKKVFGVEGLPIKNGLGLKNFGYLHEMNVFTLSIPLSIDKRNAMFARPNMGTDLWVVQSDFFNEFTAQCGDMVFAIVKSTTRKCPTGARREFKSHQQDVLGWSEKQRSGGWSNT
jgi:hypothetical protein